jgi:mRNA-degrading endonuclease RelE of RelBE toxin-antitoxin system
MVNEGYSVEVTRRAEKDLDDLGEEGAATATRALLALESNPTRGHTLTGSLTGARSLEFSMPGGQYRAAYVVLPAERLCLVFMVGPHENFYREAERRYQRLKKRRPL